MSSVLPGTQTRALECVAEKFVVDFARNSGISREPWRSQQSKAYYQRLTGEFIGQSQLQKWAVDEALLEKPEVMLAMLGHLCQRVAKKHYAIEKVYESISAMALASTRVTNDASEARRQLVQVQQQLAQLGYETPQTGELDVATRHVLAAFQMHYRPSRFDGTPDAESAAILKVLNTHK